MGYAPAGAPGYAPQPPPRKSGAMKWILIGCGTLGLIGVLCVGAVGFAGWYAYQQFKPIIEEAQTFIKANQVIEEKIGRLDDDQGVQMRKWNFQDEQGLIEARLRGAKGSGDVVINLKKIGDRWKITDGLLTLDSGEKVPLAGTSD